MIRRSALPLAVFVALAAACDSGDASVPTRPTPPPASAGVASAQGQVTVAAVTPMSGSTLKVHDCGPSTSGLTGTHVCTEEWKATLDIVVDRAVPRAVVTVTFEGSAGRCGVAYITDLSFAAQRSQRINTASALFMTYEPEGADEVAIARFCSEPARTTRMVVELWAVDGGLGSAAIPLLRQTFDYPYTFVPA